MPVSTTTAKAGQATRAKARATALVASGDTLRTVGTTPASAIWPPTHTDAARMCRNRRTVVRLGASTPTCYRTRSERCQNVTRRQAAVVHRRAGQQRATEHRRRRDLDRRLQVANVPRRRKVLVLVGDSDDLDTVLGCEASEHGVDQFLGRGRAGGDADRASQVVGQLV